MSGRVLAAALGALGCLFAGVATAQAVPSDTLGRTTLDARVVPAGAGPGFTTLTLGPGDPVDVRRDLALGLPGRENRRQSLLYLAQLSDFQLADEESPARAEFLDTVSSVFAGAWRPEEALMPYVVNASVEQVNAHATSPFAGRGGAHAAMDLAVTTGDNADNNQRNEVRWVGTLLDGGPLDPNSGRADPEALRGAGCAGADAAALAAEAPRYTGVQDARDAGVRPSFYDPEAPAGRFADWPSYPGLLDRAQQPFEAAGLDVPSFVAVGNHDGLVQGNIAASALTNSVATGCWKPLVAAPVARAAANDALAALAAPGATKRLVPPDPDRAEVTKAEYRAVLADGGDDHGFAHVDADELAASGGAASYYSFSPRPGIRLVALDTVSTGGIVGISADGNVDDPQFRWLQRTLDAAEAADELVVVYSHHGPTSLTAGVPDELAGACDDPQRPTRPGCDADPRDSRPIHLGNDVKALLLAHPHVIAWVAGHSHVNDVAVVRRTGAPRGGFWVVRTSAEADFPHQDRLIDVMDNGDGTLSLMSALLDDAAPSQAPPSGTAAAGLSADELASIARTLGYNDPQRDPGAVGDEVDRNVELLLPDPRR